MEWIYWTFSAGQLGAALDAWRERCEREGAGHDAGFAADMIRSFLLSPEAERAKLICRFDMPDPTAQKGAPE